MRNFSQTSYNVFQTYTVNCGEYQCDIPTRKGEEWPGSPHTIVKALADALEVAVPHVQHELAELARNGCVVNSVLAPSEQRVLADFHEFRTYVAKSISDDGQRTVPAVFVYVNINTGRSVSWIHSVS